MLFSKSIFLIIFLIVIVFIIRYSYSKVRNKKIYFLSFGGPTKEYHEAVERIGRQARKCGIFHEVITMKDTDLDKTFWNQNRKFTETHPRGFGYWIWKSYINLQLVKRINHGDIVLYADAGCEIDYRAIDKMSEYLNFLETNDMLSFALGLQEKAWTKMDLFKKLNCDEEIMNSSQLHATTFMYKKTDQTLQLLEEWYKVCCDYHNVDDSPSVLPNDSSFNEHRHDQSIFSILRKKSKIGKIIPDESTFIKQVRNRTGVSVIGLD